MSVVRVNELDKKLALLKEQMKDFVIRSINSRPETVFTFKINNVSHFLKTPDEKRFSDRFYVRNIAFFCVIQNKISPGHLEVFLHCDHDPKDKKFSCFVKVELELTTNSNDAKPLRQNFEFEYLRRMGCGVQSFVSHAELNNPRNSYVQNDCIYVRINLVSDKPAGV